MTLPFTPILTPKHFRWFFITLFSTVLGYLFITIWGGWDQVFTIIKETGIKGVFLCLFLSLINFGLRFIRWQLFLKKVGFPLGWLKSLPIYLGGFALTTTPGKTGEAIRSLFLKKEGIPYKKSFAAFLAERFYDLIAVLLIAILSLKSHLDTGIFLILIFLSLCLVTYLLQNQKLLTYIEGLVRKKFPQKISKYLLFLLDTLASFKECFSYSTLGYGLTLGILAWGAEGLALYLLLHWLGIEISFYSTQFIYAFSLLIGSITFLPGGLGSTEAAMLKLLLIQGLTTSMAIALTLIIRLATLWFSVLIGACILPILARPDYRSSS